MEIPPLVDIYADGWCGIDNLGTTFRTVFFVFVRGQNGLLTRIPVASIIRPQSCIDRNGRIAQLLRTQEPPQWAPPMAAGISH